jgi:uncharacterized repeat protein (TIGR03803 family)
VSVALGAFDYARAGVYRTEYIFSGGADGIAPSGGLVSIGGKFYGVTGGGGSANRGTVYTLDPATGGEAVVYTFTGGADGAGPVGELVDVGGVLYGATQGGGAYNVGVVFSLDPATGRETVIYSFKDKPDGSYPSTGPIKIGARLYGFTVGGGAGHAGTFYSLDPVTGHEKVIYAFHGGADGDGPLSYPVDVNGFLYGVTAGGGGSANCRHGCGTVFRIDPSTGDEAVVYAFAGGSDGASPISGMIEKDGALFGTTERGGGACADFGCGTVFSFDPVRDAETVLHVFNAGVDGAFPSGRLIEVGPLLYGTTLTGGDHGIGTMFSIDPSTGIERVVYAFRGKIYGGEPSGDLSYRGNRLYGVTVTGGGRACGRSGCGTVYSVKP